MHEETALMVILKLVIGGLGVILIVIVAVIWSLLSSEQSLKKTFRHLSPTEYISLLNFVVGQLLSPV